MKPLVDGLLAAAHGYSSVHLERLVRLATVIADTGTGKL